MCIRRNCMRQSKKHDSSSDDDQCKSGIAPVAPVAHLRQQRFASKPPKKVARQPTRESCAFCGEEQTEMDVKSKNILVRCSEHLSHKYCKNRCREAHAELF